MIGFGIDLSVEFRRVMVRVCKNDGMYSYSRPIGTTDKKSISRLDLWTDLQYKIKDDEDFFVTENGQIRIYDKMKSYFQRLFRYSD